MRSERASLVSALSSMQIAWAPSRANISAVAWPRPQASPAITAVFPLKFIVFPLYGWEIEPDPFQASLGRAGGRESGRAGGRELRCLVFGWMGATDRRRHDLVRHVEVPDGRAAFPGELLDQLRQLRQVLDGLALDPEPARDGREIAVAEHRPVLGEPLRAELVHLRAVGAVVHHDDQDVHPVALDGFELLRSEERRV